ncbi:hypothetical protein P7G87_00565 [Enterococcus asini]|uniref:hypothetical protein n=1 Tax=Enterococcus asini TaxID=57732 RepID=UPI00288E6377|nr:hypothetical protein [Enterococcus asini]MDT2783180.1 hypothetical protein [Enterococcus asini]
MRVEITGHIDADEMQETFGKALELWADKIAADNPDMKEMLDKVEDVDITEMSAVLRFKVEGIADWQVITTDNHAEIPELLTVTVETDEQGNILTDTVKDNDGDSDYSDIEALIAAGLHKQELKPADSIYTAGELTEVAGYYIGDYRISISTDTEGQVVVHAEELNWQGDGRLVAETVFPADQLDKIKQHYLELAEATAE